MNILITSAGRRTYIIDYFREALSGCGLVHASNSEMTYTLTQADRCVVTPMIYDDNYVTFLLDYCAKESIGAIISLFDIDLPVLSKSRERFREIGVEVVVSLPEVIEICNDKWKTYGYIKDLGLSQPLTYLTIDDTVEALESGKLAFPIIIKPRWGVGSIGLYQVDSLEELKLFYGKLKREIFNSYLKFESNGDVDSCILMQEKIEGREFGLDILNDLNGVNATVIPKEKIAMRAGETDIARVNYNPNLVELGRVIATSLRHIGNLDLDCFVKPNGEIVVIEMNARFGGQYPFSHVAGADFPKQIIMWLKGGATDPNLLNAKDNMLLCKELVPVRVL